MRRREFIKLLGGTAAAWPLAARAQQADRVRMVHMNGDRSAIEELGRGFRTRSGRAGLEAGEQSADRVSLGQRREPLQKVCARIACTHSGGCSGCQWIECERVARDYQHSTGRLHGDQRSDQPQTDREYGATGGNFTGFIEFEPSIGAKWLELLKQIAPNVTRVAVLRDPTRLSWRSLVTAIEKAAPSLNVDVSPVDARDAMQMERALTAFASRPNGGLIVTPSAFSAIFRDRIIALAARQKLPAIYFSPFFATDGGLSSYSPDIIDQYRRAAVYVDRILKGEKPGDMPVQAPSKFEFIVNLRTAQAIDLTVPAGVLAVADHVIK